MFKIFFFIVFFAVLLFLLAGFSIIRTVKSFFFGPSNATHATRHRILHSRYIFLPLPRFVADC